MKKLHFRYEMTLNLSQEVVDHHFLVHCRPMASEGQGLIGFSCHVDPEVALNHVTDGFGNQGLGGVIRTPHDRFHVTAEGEVDVRVYRMRDYHPMYRFQTPYTAPDERILDFLRETERMLRGPIRGLDELNFLMGRLYGRFVYAPGVTTTRTTAAEAFAGGRGVCQDYAHVFIGLCRAAGIPARYVAGMMTGEGATHAWTEVWTEDGWIGMDPTNNRFTDDSYIRLAHGRDFADGAVDKGCFMRFAIQTQQVYVKVEEVTGYA